jgi:hypothetical protein
MPNKPTVVRTNSTPGSIKVVGLKALRFQEPIGAAVISTFGTEHD